MIQVTPKRVPVRRHIAFDQGTQQEWFCDCSKDHVHEGVLADVPRPIRAYSSYMAAIAYMYLGIGEGRTV